MLNTESQLSDPEALSVNATVKKGSKTPSTLSSTTTTKTDTMTTKSKDKVPSKKSEASSAFEWEEVKKARNRINSQRIRERERAQIANLEAERARLWLSNDAIKFQNRHFRDIIAKVIEVREMKRNRSAMPGGGMGIRGAGAPGPSSALAAQLGGLGGGPAMHMSLGMRQDMMGGRGGGLDTMFQNPRLAAASSKGLGSLSDADLLARHQVTSMEVQNMMRQQELDRYGPARGVGMGGLGLNNGMNMNAGAASPYGDIAENLRIRQLMLQQTGAPGDGLLSSIGGGGMGPSNPLGAGTGLDAGSGNGGGLSLGGGGALGDLGGGIGGIGDMDIFQMSKRQKFGL